MHCQTFLEIAGTAVQSASAKTNDPLMTGKVINYGVRRAGKYNCPNANHHDDVTEHVCTGLAL